MANTFTFANQTLTDADIYGGIGYMCDLNTGDEFSIGNTASACVKFVTDKQVPIYTKDQTNGYFEWVQDLVSRGTYYVTECVKVNGSWYSVTAYDAMILLDTSITALSLSYPLTVSAAASAIATYLGCTTSGTIYNGTMTCDALDDTTTIRQLLSWVAEASGASVKIDNADHIVFLYYASSGITVTASDYKEDGLDVADYTCAAIDNVTIINNVGAQQATAGAGSNSLYIVQNPFLNEATATEAAAILAVVDSFVYTPLTCDMFEDNGLEVGVVATFGTASTLVMHLESSEDGVIVSSVGTDSRAEYNKSIDIIAMEAISIANEAAATGQYFWHTATDTGAGAGAHITQEPKDDFLADVALDPTAGGGNLLANSNGIAVRDGLTELATFGSTATIGLTSDYHLDIASAGAVIKKGALSLLKITGQIVSAIDNWKRAFIEMTTGSNKAEIYMDASDGAGDVNVVGTAGSAIAQVNVGASSYLGNIASVDIKASADGGATNKSIRVSDSIGIEIDGNVFILDHTNTQGAIGHFSSDSGTNSSFATGNSLTQINAPVKFSAGTWLIIGDVVYPNNTNGSRCVEWRSGATTSSLASINASRVIGGTASSGFSTRMQTVAVVQSNADVYLSMYGYMYTGSSTTVSVNWYWRAIRIA